MAEEEGASAMYRAPRTLLETLRTDLIVSIDRFARINYRWNNYEFNGLYTTSTGIVKKGKWIANRFVSGTLKTQHNVVYEGNWKVNEFIGKITLKDKFVFDGKISYDAATNMSCYDGVLHLLKFKMPIY